MLSYVGRRRRWWKILTEFGSSMELSESLRRELLLELSALQGQEILVVKACAVTEDFEGYAAAILVDHYSGIYMRGGGQSWNGQSSVSPKGKGFANRFGKGNSFQRQAYRPPRLGNLSMTPRRPGRGSRLQ